MKKNNKNKIKIRQNLIELQGNSFDISKICDNLLENVNNSLKNCKNNNYKKGLYPFKIMKQLLIQLSSDVYLNKEGVPFIKVIDKTKFENILNIVNTYVETHNIDEIESLLYSEHISKDLGLKKCHDTDIHLFLYNVEVPFETICGPSEFYTGHSEYDKVIKNILKQGQESDVSKKYLKDIENKFYRSVRIPLFEPNNHPFYRVQDNPYTVIHDFPYIHDGYEIQCILESIREDITTISSDICNSIRLRGL